jgi:pimeloyl-ACP methyl ester carboxylesterase
MMKTIGKEESMHAVKTVSLVRIMAAAVALWGFGCGDGEGDDVDGDADAGHDAEVEAEAEGPGDPLEDIPHDEGPDDGTEAEDPVSEDAAGDDGWTLPELEWTSCSLYEGEDDGRAQCAEMQAPWRWGEDDGRTFTVFAKRLPARSAPTAQIWLLEGGPGGAGSFAYPEYMDFFSRAFPNFDSYTLDARGTGYSQFLPCPADDTGRELTFADTMEELDHCIAWLSSEYGDDLDVFGATQSAHDLGAFIQATRTDDRKIFVWGNSAGTYWSFRFLQLFPDLVDGVIAEALLTPDFFGGFQDEAIEGSARAVLAMCEADAFCSSKLPDPVGALRSLLASLEGGHCSAEGWSAEALRGLVGFLLYYRPFNETIPAVIYRLTRCAPSDMEALDALASYTFPISADTGFSIAVYFNEYFSEMWDHPTYSDSEAFFAYLDALYEDALIISGEGYAMHEILQRWPVYEDPLVDQWAETDVPMLLLHGHLDPATPYALAAPAADHFSAANQHFLDFPYAAHGIIFNTPTGHSPLAYDCGLGLLEQFLDDPEAGLDTSCMDLVVSFDFEGTHDAARIMGTADYWD